MIELNCVSKGYKLKGVRKQILDKASIRIPRDQNIAILGRNGAGKSTLMRVIAGVELPDSGQVIRSSKVSWPLGFKGGFNSTMTGVENIKFVSRLYGHDSRAVIDYVADFSELGKSLKLPVKTYSNGMKARLAFGLSMAIDFDTYLIDEITAVGDQSFKRKSKAVFDEKLSGRQIIMISHSMQTIRKYCSAGLFLEGGKLYYYDNIEEIIRDYKLMLAQ
ncbi:ABC transporter ATP-binding protein [Shimia sp. R11_0]|uniref:ABC transporter ATP-binding protein n=1 Tax=Shimia sp. R11_0 TaxID=2821096 RepID=UPI001AD981DF|nr:ABC transporter ATP-binding protein [Shimia sp. R11_0]MBO9479404.1 ABC transporter ATP-binding protein [Shimia sp. R11_0]